MCLILKQTVFWMMLFLKNLFEKMCRLEKALDIEIHFFSVSLY